MPVSIEARNAFERLIQRDPDHLDHYYDYAQMLAAMDNHSEALVKLGTAQAFIAVAAESLSGADESALSSVRLQTLR